MTLSKSTEARVTCSRAIVIGSGPAGLAAALSCTAQGFRVDVLDRDSLEGYRPGECLSPRGRRALSALGVPHEVVAHTVRNTYNVEFLWGDDEFKSRESIFDPYGHSWILARPEFDRALARFAISQGIDIQLKTTVRSVALVGSTRIVTAAGPQGSIILQGDVVIDASGRQSTFCRRFGALPSYYDRLVGITATSTAEAGRHSNLLIESLSNGWWYSVEIPKNRLVATFMTDADLVRLEGGPQKVWEKALATAGGTRQRWSGAQSPEKLHLRSARTRILNTVYGERWLVVGDAAFSQDPLSGEGIASALEDGLAVGQKASLLVDNRSFSTDHLGRVKDYLRSRAHVYAQERRWKECPFWCRRQQRNWATTELNLDPETRFQRTGSFLIPDIKQFSPGVDSGALAAAMDRGSTVGEVAVIYRTMHTPQCSDEELIACLQFVVESVKGSNEGSGGNNFHTGTK